VSDPLAQNRRDFLDFCDMRGLAPEAFQHDTLGLKRETDRCHAVLRYRSDDAGYVVKTILRPVDRAGFEARLKPHVIAQNQNLPVPQIEHIFEDRQSVVMAAVDGQTALDIGSSSARAAGAWLGVFHLKTRNGTRAFNPDFMMRHLSRLREDTHKRRRRISSFRRWSGALDHIAPFAKAANGAPVTSALSHGDFNAKNILINETGAVGLDFAAYKTAPNAYDIARFLVHLTSANRSLNWSHATAVNPKLLSAFTDGYAASISIKPDDPVLQFVLRTRILIDWAALNNSGWSLAKLRRYLKLRRAASVIF
jgi:Ser/Thr protein kinase RdoA (MazF antagonist)